MSIVNVYHVLMYFEWKRLVIIMLNITKDVFF